MGFILELQFKSALLSVASDETFRKTVIGRALEKSRKGSELRAFGKRTVSIMGVGSTGDCNRRIKYISWCFKSQRLPRTSIQLLSNSVKVGLTMNA